MSKEKQIEKMVKEFCDGYGEKCGGCGCKPCAYIEHCKTLYNAGYRKQSENVVEFPCKIGQTFYVVDVCAEKIIERKVTELSINEFGTTYIRSFGFGYPDSSIGKTVFLTKAEAEAKMKGGAE